MLLESPHVAEEVIVAGTTKTIDIMGHAQAYKSPGFKMTDFLASIKHHAYKSVTWVAIDLKGASKQQIAEITAYVKTLDKKIAG